MEIKRPKEQDEYSKSPVVAPENEASYDYSSDIILTDDEGDRIASMREYVFINLASSAN